MSWLPEELTYLEKFIMPEPNSGCWLWIGPILTKEGYGYADRLSRTPIHRQFYFIFKGKIEQNNHIYHKCQITCCVNPEHLESLTPTNHMKLHKTNPLVIEFEELVLELLAE